MPRERKGLGRKSGGQSKDPTIFYIIAAEGSDTEMIYFQQIKSFLETLRLGRLVKVEPLERAQTLNQSGQIKKDTRSDTEAIVTLLDDYRKKYNIKDGDELWCIVDRDRWLHKNIAAADKSCRQKGYEFCMTTPCFEFWLLLHLRDLRSFSTVGQVALLHNLRKKSGNRTRTEYEVNEATKALGAGAYKKASLPNVFTLRIPNAVRQAFDLRLEEDHWQGDRFCTRIHVLLQRIFELSAPEYNLPLR